MWQTNNNCNNYSSNKESGVDEMFMRKGLNLEMSKLSRGIL